MNSELVGPQSGDDEGQVVLAGGQRVSMQLLQQMYKEVTGRTERMTRRFDCNHRAEFADLENLNAKIDHLLEQYHVAEKNCTVTFFHTNDSTERYSSFDRARAFEQASLSPVENVRVEYDFLIILPVAKKPQPYKIVIDVHSRAAISEKIRAKSGFEAKYFVALSEGSGAVAIEYVDYAVARNMMEAIAQWFEGLAQESTPRLLSFCKKWSHHFSWWLKYLTAISLAFFFLRGFEGTNSSNGVGSIFYYGAVSFFSVYIISGLAFNLGNIIESGVDGYQPLSYLKINRGDEKIVNSYSRHMGFRALKSVVSMLTALAINLMGVWIASRLHL